MGAIVGNWALNASHSDDIAADTATSVTAAHRHRACRAPARAVRTALAFLRGGRVDGTGKATDGGSDLQSYGWKDASETSPAVSGTRCSRPATRCGSIASTCAPTDERFSIALEQAVADAGGGHRAAEPGRRWAAWARTMTGRASATTRFDSPRSLPEPMDCPCGCSGSPVPRRC